MRFVWIGLLLFHSLHAQPPNASVPSSDLNADFQATLELRSSTEIPVGMAFDFPLPIPEDSDPSTIRVVADFRTNARFLPAQFRSGALTIVLEQGLPAKMPQQLTVFASRKSRSATKPSVATSVTVEENVPFQGQLSLSIQTETAGYRFHQEGGGFASLFDKEGNDWIQYRPGGRAAGEFRGIPNLGDFAHPGYSGNKGVATKIEEAGPLKLVFRSMSLDAQNETIWTIYPDRAVLQVLKTAKPFWFLYEGTPAGKLDLNTGFWGLPDGEKRGLETVFNDDLLGLEWVYFGDESSTRTLLLVNHQDDLANDQFWQMDSSMTVFGFGREYRCCGKFLQAPARFTVTFAETEFAAIEKRAQASVATIENKLGEWKSVRAPREKASQPTPPR
jgi:hypothetical protein